MLISHLHKEHMLDFRDLYECICISRQTLPPAQGSVHADSDRLQV